MTAMLPFRSNQRLDSLIFLFFLQSAVVTNGFSSLVKIQGLNSIKTCNNEKTIRLFLKRQEENVRRRNKKQEPQVDIDQSCLLSSETDIKLDATNKDNNENPIMSRRRQLTTAAGMMLSSILSSDVANAYEKAYPLELKSIDSEYSTKIQKVKEMKHQERKGKVSKPTNKFLATIVWGTSLWWLSGSRSNPIATPLANVLYKLENEKWLQDRNNGWFAALPWEFLVILGVIYLCFGYITDTIVAILTTSATNPSVASVPTDTSLLLPFFSSSSSLSVQLAFVTLIGAGSLELGRIFSGEKQSTKYEARRDEQLQKEFDEFARKRLKIGNSISNNVHRNEVVAAFRRFYSKYRMAPTNEQSQLLLQQQQKIMNQQMFQQPSTPSEDSSNIDNQVAVLTTASTKEEIMDDLVTIDNVTDLEIHRLLRTWAKTNYNIEMTSAGFYSGIQINRDADVFISL